MEILSNYQYKKLFLPNITEKILANNADIQIYRIEDYLKGILMPVPPYRTSFNFMIFVTNGRMKQFVDNQELEANQENIIFIKQGIITATTELSEDIEGFFLAYENKILSEQVILKNHTRIFFSSPLLKMDPLNFKTMVELLQVMEQEICFENFNVNDVVLCVLQLILLKISHVGNHKTHTSVTRPIEISLQFRDLLFKLHKCEKKVAFYSDSLSVTENYLNKCVKTVTQKSPKQWITEVDINYSKVLLQSSKDISEIAYELNYNTASHFSQVFKKNTGKTPKEYRDSYF